MIPRKENFADIEMIMMITKDQDQDIVHPAERLSEMV
jgi:hypothetical protein